MEHLENNQRTTVEQFSLILLPSKNILQDTFLMETKQIPDALPHIEHIRKKYACKGMQRLQLNIGKNVYEG